MLSYFLLFSNFAISAPPPPLWGPAPKDIQYRYHTEEISAFIHYGMNTYTGIEWGDGSEDPNLFKPTNLDTDQWVSVLKRAGFKRLIMVGRHHDGFCNWKTKFSNHSVNLSVDFQLISQFLHQSGDVLEEVSKSCTKFNVDMGLYLSPWDVNSSYYGDEVLYNEYYMNQLDEILNSNKRYGNNGKIVEVWMDGAKGEGSKAQIYWFSKWFELIRKHQPECVIWSGHGSEVRWIGNEKGIAGEPCWDRFDLDNQIACADKLPTCDPNLQDPNTGLATGQNYSVGECDVSITNGWFWKSGKVPKTMKELASIYFTSVARGQILLLNVPPNVEGKMPEDMSNNALQLGRDIWESFSLDFVRQNGVKFSATNTRESDTNMFSPENVADGTNKTYWTMDDDKTTGSITIDFGRFRTFDIVSIREHIHLGQRIARASVDYHTKDGWKTLSTITTIGYHRIIRLDPVSADMIRVNILESQAVPLIQNIEVFLSVGSISQKVVPPDGVTEIPNSQFTKTGTWKDSEDGITNDKSGSSLEAKFTGTRCFVIGTIDPKYGKLNIFIDNQQVATIDCAITSTAVSLASTRITKSVLYQYDGELSDGEHTLKVVVAENKAVQIHSFTSLSNDRHGMFEFSQREYSITAGGVVEVEIKRVGGSTGKATVSIETARGSAAEGRCFDHFKSSLVFNNDETSKTVKIQTKISEEDRGIGDLEFFVKLVSDDPNDGAVVGYNSSSIVTIKDVEASKERILLRKQNENHKIMIYSLIGSVIFIVALVAVILIVFMNRKSHGEPLCNEELNTYTE